MSTRLTLDEMNKSVSYIGDLDDTHWVGLGHAGSDNKWAYQVHEQDEGCLTHSDWEYAEPEDALEAALEWFAENVENAMKLLDTLE